MRIRLLSCYLFIVFSFFINAISQAQISWAYGSYTGNGGASTVVGVGFQPAAVMIKSEGASQAVIVTEDMPVGETKGLGTSDAHTTGRISSIDSDGFTIGSDAEVNSLGVVYQWIAFEGGDDVEVGTWTGTGAVSGSGVTVSPGFQPEMIWYWGNTGNARDDATMYLVQNTEKCDRFFDGHRDVDWIGSLSATGFTTGSDAESRNRSGSEYYYIAFNEGTDLVDGGFQGNTTDGRSISTGWQPELVIGNAAVDNHRPVMRTASMTGDASLRFSAQATYANAIQSFTATTFTVGTHQLAHDAWNSNDWVALKGGSNPTVTITLPVELIEFDVNVLGNQVVVEWTTAAEINNDHFFVERSTDGFNYEVIKVVQGAGNSTEVINYVIYDDNPPRGVLYYRIRQTDFNGDFEVFDAKSVSIGTNDLVSWIHTTGSGKHKINLYGGVKGVYNIQILNLNGALVVDTDYQVANGGNKTSALIDLPTNLSDGVYLVNIKSEDYQNSGKIVIGDTNR